MTTKPVSGEEVLDALRRLGPASAQPFARNTVYLWCMAVARGKGEDQRPWWEEAAEHVVAWLELHGVTLRINTPAGAAGYLRMALLHAKTSLWREAHRKVAQDLAAARRLEHIAAKRGVSVESLALRKPTPARDRPTPRPSLQARIDRDRLEVGRASFLHSIQPLLSARDAEILEVVHARGAARAPEVLTAMSNGALLDPLQQTRARERHRRAVARARERAWAAYEQLSNDDRVEEKRRAALTEWPTTPRVVRASPALQHYLLSLRVREGSRSPKLGRRAFSTSVFPALDREAQRVLRGLDAARLGPTQRRPTEQQRLALLTSLTKAAEAIRERTTDLGPRHAAVVGWHQTLKAKAAALLRPPPGESPCA